MKHFRNMLVLVVLLALLGASQPVVVHADELPVMPSAVPVAIANAAANSDANVILPQYRVPYDFDIHIDAFGYQDTTDTYTVAAGKYVVGYLQNSGGHNVYMTVIRASDQYALAAR